MAQEHGRARAQSEPQAEPEKKQHGCLHEKRKQNEGDDTADTCADDTPSALGAHRTLDRIGHEQHGRRRGIGALDVEPIGKPKGQGSGQNRTEHMAPSRREDIDAPHGAKASSRTAAQVASQAGIPVRHDHIHAAPSLRTSNDTAGRSAGRTLPAVPGPALDNAL